MGSLNSWKFNYPVSDLEGRQCWLKHNTCHNLTPHWTATRLNGHPNAVLSPGDIWHSKVLLTLPDQNNSYSEAPSLMVFLQEVFPDPPRFSWVFHSTPRASIVPVSQHLWHSIEIFVSFSVYFPTTFLNSGRAKDLFSWFILVSSGPPQCLLNNNTYLDVLSNICQTLF